uniref:Uncharacterized protein n=1 Tax=Anopheles atroparvus TaxID=41427 RepID=A0AAG5DA84_ANOAO
MLTKHFLACGEARVFREFGMVFFQAFRFLSTVRKNKLKLKAMFHQIRPLKFCQQIGSI